MSSNAPKMRRTRGLSTPTVAAAGRAKLDRRSRLDPASEDFDLVVCPSAVARHRAVAQTLEDRSAVADDVVARPEVERPLHRLAVAVAKEWLDVLLETDRLVDGGQGELLSETLGCEQRG